jgi:hypothetical protein
MESLKATIISHEFVDNIMPNLSLTGVKIFLVIARLTTGFAGETRKYIPLDEIMNRVKLSIDAVKPAMKELEEKCIILIEHRRGRGNANGYTINYQIENLQNKRGVINNGFKKGGLEPSIHGFGNDLFLESPAPEQPRAAMPPPDKPAKLKPVKHKRSDEELTAFKELWDVFEKAIGCKIAGKDAAMEAKSIWELIDRKRDGNGGLAELKEIVCKFIEMRKNPPDGLEYLGKLLPLPHILNSTRTWLNVTTQEVVTDRTPTKEETAEYVKSIREKCGKK